MRKQIKHALRVYRILYFLTSIRHSIGKSYAHYTDTWWGLCLFCLHKNHFELYDTLRIDMGRHGVYFAKPYQQCYTQEEALLSIQTRIDYLKSLL